MHLAIDAMGSDNHPAPDIQGAVMALTRWPDDVVTLVGDTDSINRSLGQLNVASAVRERLRVVHASEAVAMSDKPSVVLQSKRDSSMHVGLRLVERGQVAGFVSAGNTGALWTIAALAAVRRLRGVLRPVLGAYVPWPGGGFVLVDAGGSVTCGPEQLAQFAHLGCAYSACVYGVERPRVALLSNGEESGKGSELARATWDLLHGAGLDFMGYAEPAHVLNGFADVVVTDGFTGNIMLKTIEATSAAFCSALAPLARGSEHAEQLIRGFDPEAYSGAIVLGLNGVVVAAHGAASPWGILGAIDVARRAIAANLVSAQRAVVDAVPGQAMSCQVSAEG